MTWDTLNRTHVEIASESRLRLLFLNNFYPPVRSGGYAQLCQEVAQGLQARGHEVTILTSNHQSRQAALDRTEIYRKLHLEMDLNYYRRSDLFLHQDRRRRQNLAILQQVIDVYQPDVLLIWSLWALSKSLAMQAEQRLPDRTAYYLAGYWPVSEDEHRAFWRRPARRSYLRPLKRVLGRFALRKLATAVEPGPEFRRVMCVSASLKDSLINAGLPIDDAQVVYNGVDPDVFHPVSEESPVDLRDGNFKLLYAGQVADHKGVHTAIQALDRLVNKRNFTGVHLTILGSGHPDYAAFLHRMVDEARLTKYVEFQQPIPREGMPAMLRCFDGLIFPSIYAEPLARINQEAMSCELVVIATNTGGTQELISDGKNGLFVPPEDADGLADWIERLAADVELRNRLAKAGRQTILERFTMKRMLDEVEAYLYGVVSP